MRMYRILSDLRQSCAEAFIDFYDAFYGINDGRDPERARSHRWLAAQRIALEALPYLNTDKIATVDALLLDIAEDITGIG